MAWSCTTAYRLLNRLHTSHRGDHHTSSSSTATTHTATTTATLTDRSAVLLIVVHQWAIDVAVGGCGSTSHHAKAHQEEEADLDEREDDLQDERGQEEGPQLRVVLREALFARLVHGGVLYDSPRKDAQSDGALDDREGSY
jgi:hypothetical protein